MLAALAVSAAAGLAGCGPGGPDRTPSLRKLPLAHGTRVTVESRRCNIGANAYCALQLVVVGSSYRTSAQLLAKERAALLEQGWTLTRAGNGLEHAADSPGNKLHVIYATASSELQGVDLGWIRRARRVTLALSQSIFSHTATLALVLEFGS